MKKTRKITFEEYDNAISLLAQKIKASGKKYTAVYGIPRGGYYPAIQLSNILGIPAITSPISGVLVVDDIMDSGATLTPYTQDKAVVYCKDIEKAEKSGIFYAEPFNEWLDIPDEKGCGIEDHIRRMLEYIGEDPNREGLIGTPDRIVRMWKEIYRGYDPAQKPKITIFDNGKDGITYDNMVVDSGKFNSMCVPHFQVVNSVNGSKTARSVKVGEQLWTLRNGVPVKTTVTHISTHRATNVIKLTLSNGKCIYLTADHPLKVGDWWYEAGDTLGMDVEYINPASFSQRHYDFNICRELGYFLAVVAAECSIQEDRRICLETENEAVADKFIMATEKVFGRRFNKESILKPSSFTGKKFKQYRVRIVSSEIARRTLKMLKIPYNTIGCGSKTFVFHLPEIVKYDYECWRGFLEGYLDTDGTRYRGKKEEYDRIVSSNANFIKEIRDFMGMPMPKGRMNEVSQVPCYSTNISEKYQTEAWFNKHGFKRFSKWFDLGESETVQVVAIEKIEKPIKVYSFTCDGDHTFCVSGVLTHNCEHHLMPFWGKYWFAYIPNPQGKILGLSKIARVVDYCAARAQIQERLVHDVVKMLKEALDCENPPLGMALVMKAHHGCKEFRGVKKEGLMTSSYLDGAFKEDAQVRSEFMSLVNNSKEE